jgi:hypothetical protein
MKIKNLYFGIFWDAAFEAYNHMLQTPDGKWFLFHIPRTREVEQRDLHEITEAEAKEFLKRADRFTPAVLDRGLCCTGLELIEEKEE